MKTLTLDICNHHLEVEMDQEDDLVQLLVLLSEIIRRHGVAKGFSRIQNAFPDGRVHVMKVTT